MNNILKGNKLAVCTTIIIAIVLLLTLFVFRYGVSDNGDLTGRLEQLGLYDAQYASGAGTGEYPNSFGVSEPGTGFSTADFPYLLAKLVSGDIVYSAVPAFIYLIILLIGIFLLLKNAFGKYDWNNILLSLMCLFILADSGYTAFLNTPYIEAAAYVYLIFTIGACLWACKEKNGILAGIIAGIAGTLFAGVSIITAWIGFLIAVFFIRLYFAKPTVAQKIISLLCAIVVAVVSAATIYFAEPQDAKLFDSVFYGVAVEDETQAQALGIDEKTAQAFSGKASFEEDSMRYLSATRFSDSVSYTDISLFYLLHPSVYIKNLEKVANNSVMISTEYLGNYPYGSGKGLAQGEFFKLYSQIKSRLIPANLWIIVVIWIALCIGVLFYRKKYAMHTQSKLVCDLILLCVLATIIAFKLPLILGGLVQIGFYMHLYNLLFDICLIVILVGGSKMLWIRREALKEKYGVNQ